MSAIEDWLTMTVKLSLSIKSRLNGSNKRKAKETNDKAKATTDKGNNIGKENNSLKPTFPQGINKIQEAFIAK